MEPTEEEQLHYYDGLLSRPRLLARTSSARHWQRQMHGGIPSGVPYFEAPFRRQLLPPPNHAVADAWHDADGPLRVGLLRALEGLPWTAIDWFRVGIGRERPISDTFELTMMVSVSNDMVNPSDAIEAAHRCKSVLEECGFADIHCEIRKSTVHFLTEDFATTSRSSNEALMPVSKPCHGGDLDNTRFDSMIGTQIAILSRPNVTATKGLYLRGKYSGQEYTLALTCRHLLTTTSGNNVDIVPQSASENPDLDQTIRDPESLVIQLSDDKIRQLHEWNDLAFLPGCDSKIPADQRKPGLIRQIHQYREMYQSRASFLARLRSADSRVFGSIFLSPAITQTSQSTSTTEYWIMDWMLIKLDACRHEEKLSTLNNTLYLAKTDMFKAFDVAQCRHFSGRLLDPREQDEVEDNDWTPAYIQIPLKGVVGIADMRKPAVRGDDYDPAMLVGKIGQKTKLTIGFSSTFKSVIRTLVDDVKVESEVWPVITNRDVAFSAKGDSGSCLWDMDGRVAGMIVAGNGKPYPDGFVVDVTYVLPMEVMLEDMERRGFQASV